MIVTAGCAWDTFRLSAMIVYSESPLTTAQHTLQRTCDYPLISSHNISALRYFYFDL